MFESCFNQLGTYFAQKSIIGLCGGVMLQLFGGDKASAVVVAVFILLLMDTCAGTLAALKERKWSGKIMLFGFARKVMVWTLLLVTAHQVTNLNEYMFWFEEAVIIIVALTDAISTLKNLSKLGAPIPSALIDRLEKVKTENTDKLITKP